MSVIIRWLQDAQRKPLTGWWGSRRPITTVRDEAIYAGKFPVTI